MSWQRTKRSGLNRLLIYHFPALLYAAAVLYVSSLPASAVPVKLSGGLDKVAHLVEYGLFAWIIFRSFYDLLSHRSIRLVVMTGSVFILLFAALDELFQGSIPGRHQDPADLAVDFVSGVLILILLGLRARRKLASNSAD